MEFLLDRSDAELNALREEFANAPDRRLTVPRFIAALLPYYDADLSDTQKRIQLTRLFRAVDVDGDQKVSWDDFSSYAIEDKLRQSRPLPHEAIRPYKCTDYYEHRNGGSVQKMVHLKHWDKLVISSRKLPYTILNTSNMSHYHTMLPSAFDGAPVACEYVPTARLFVTSTVCPLALL